MMFMGVMPLMPIVANGHPTEATVDATVDQNTTNATKATNATNAAGAAGTVADTGNDTVTDTVNGTNNDSVNGSTVTNTGNNTDNTTIDRGTNTGKTTTATDDGVTANTAGDVITTTKSRLQQLYNWSLRNFIPCYPQPSHVARDFYYAEWDPESHILVLSRPSFVYWLADTSVGRLTHLCRISLVVFWFVLAFASVAVLSYGALRNTAA